MFNNGGMRNIGANGNQPLITNQNDFQFFDNVTRVAGKHTMKAGGSLTHRSREILNADTIVGRFDFNQNLTSSCAGITSRLHRRSEHRVRLRQLPARLREQRQPDAVRPGHLHGDCGPSSPRTSRTTSASTNRLTVNAGLRWDVYVPWVEVDNKQSNFDVSTGRFVVASDNATINGVEVGRYLQTYSKTRLRSAAGLCLRSATATARTIVRGGYGLFWNFTPGGTSSSKAQNQPFLQGAGDHRPASGTNILLSNGLDAAAGRRSRMCRRRVRRGRRSSPTSATLTRITSTSTCSGSSAPTTWWKRPIPDRGPRTRR